MDRMPKEYKIAIYIISIQVIYSLFYFFGLFYKFNRVDSPLKYWIIYFSLFVTLLFLIPLLFFYFKKESGRIWLICNYIFLILFDIFMAISLLFFKETASIISKLLNLDTFTPYLMLATIGMIPNKSFIAFIILLAWSIYTLIILLNREVRIFIKEKNYPLVNTQRYTSFIVFAYFASLVVVTFLINL